MTDCCPRLIQHALLPFDDPPWSRLQIRKELAWGLLHYLDSVEPNAAIMEECPGLDRLQSRVHILDCRGVDGRMPRMGWMSGKKGYIHGTLGGYGWWVDPETGMARVGCQERDDWTSLTRADVAKMSHDGADWYDRYWGAWMSILGNVK